MHITFVFIPKKRAFDIHRGKSKETKKDFREKKEPIKSIQKLKHSFQLIAYSLDYSKS